MTNLTLPIFTNADKAREHLEAIRWPDGPVCPHCGTVNQATLLKGKSHRAGMFKCNSCREPFSVTVGTVMERSHIPLNKWVLGFHLMASSKKGISAHQLHRTLGVTYKTAWFMAHRIREAMTPSSTAPLGGEGQTVEADEAYIGRKPGMKKAKGTGHKQVVFALVEREGEARAFHVPSITASTLRTVLENHVSRKAQFRTDEAPIYTHIGWNFASYETVKHQSGEYVRGDAHTNTVEGFFSILKRGVYGVYQHVSEQHLNRYLSEFSFRYSNREAAGVNDAMRASRAIKGAEGKRLTYQQPRQA
ncbi:MAG: IS1595 family transposase [Alphaproteobacteria bacterium]